MRFAYHDLGEQPEGQTVRVRLRGSAANVLLMDAANFGAYRAQQPFFYDAGGHFSTSPVDLAIPKDGRWFVVVDLGGYSGRVRASVEVVDPVQAPADADGGRELVESAQR